MTEHILTLRCENRPGIVAAVASRLAAHGGDITEAAQFDDALTGKFFMRVAFRMDGDRRRPSSRPSPPRSSASGSTGRLRSADAAAAGADPRLDVRPLHGRPALPACGSASSHGRGRHRLEPSAQHAGEERASRDIPYHHLPVTRDTKAAQEARIKGVIEETGAELVVLARYMQVLSDDFSAYLSGRCINIHHSFLPGFKGAKPYHQAHERGVKMIGATAHYVTGDLDEGPIIAQDVEHVSHADTPDDLVAQGPRHRAPGAGARRRSGISRTGCCSTATRPWSSASSQPASSSSAGITGKKAPSDQRPNWSLPSTLTVSQSSTRR